MFLLLGRVINAANVCSLHRSKHKTEETFVSINQNIIINQSIRISSDSVIWKLKGHETMLLVASQGIFCQRIFLLIAAAGILLTNHELDGGTHILCTIAIVH